MRTAVWIGGALIEDLIESPAGRATLAAPAGYDVTHNRVSLRSIEELPGVCVAHPADLVFVSVAAGFENTAATVDQSAVQAILRRAVEAVDPSVHVFFIAPSTVVSPQTSPGEVHPLTIEFHRRILAAVLVAAETGVSVIDLDRLVAEYGGAACVLGPTRYNDELLALAREEVIRILDDYRLLSDAAVPVPQRNAVA